MKEAKTTYAYLVEHMKEPSFCKVRNIACEFVQKLHPDLVDELYENLNRGIDVLDSEPLMQMYFYAYGCMHSAKLAYAFERLNYYITSADAVDIIDYGCGQGLATMCYHDFIIGHNPQQNVRSITLIEPSGVALARAELLCSCFFPQSNIKVVQKGFGELLASDFETKGDIPTLHLFSNVLDVESYDIKSFSQIVIEASHGDNDYIIVSPLHSGNRSSRLKQFVDYLDENCYFEQQLDKQQLREDKDWTCHVFLCSTCGKELTTMNPKDVTQKAKELLEDVELSSDKEYAERVFYTVKAWAEHGDAQCMNALGLLYKTGIGVPHDLQKANEWFELASKQGYPGAIGNLARSYALGIGVKKSISKAHEIAVQLQERDIKTYYAISGYLFSLEGNHVEAIECYKKGFELGDALSEFKFGRYLVKGLGCEKDVVQGVRHISHAADCEIGKAIMEMATLYESGFEEAGIEQSDSEAVKFYEIAANRGFTYAQLKLAKAYKKGLLSLKIDQTESFKWYLRLAKGGNKDAVFNVAYAFHTGEGVERDYSEAVKWYSIAVKNGSIAAMNNLGKCYEEGNGVEKDLEKAFSLYLKAAKEGSEMAATNLSLCYQEGTGTPANPEEALFWKERVAANNNVGAQVTVSKWYYKGYGTARDLEKALYWYVKSKSGSENSTISNLEEAIRKMRHKADEGQPLFQYLLAKCYDYGVCMLQDRDKALLWYQKAADNGFVEALIKLHRISLLSTTQDKNFTNRDGYGVYYSADEKIIIGNDCLRGDRYRIKDGTRIISDGAFNNHRFQKIIIPSSVILIGDNPFQQIKFWERQSVIIENHAYNYTVADFALYTKDGTHMIAYFGEANHFTVPDHVKHIGRNCFAYSTLENVTLPEGLESIGSFAFGNCLRLKAMSIPKSVKLIEEKAFYGCEALENVWSLGSISSIEPATFMGCNIKYIELPPSLRVIEDNSFNHNVQLRSITLPESIEKLGKAAFAYCHKLEYINLGESLSHIGDFCFFRCPIKQIMLPLSLCSIGTRAFDIVGTIMTKPNSRFFSDRGMLIDITTKKLECYFGDESSLDLEGICSMSPLVFYNSTVENVIIPDSVSVIPEFAFQDACKLKSIKLSSNLKLIENSAFRNCISLKEVTIPETVEEVQYASFEGCSALESIKFDGCNTNVSESIFIPKHGDRFPEAYYSYYVHYSFHTYGPPRGDEEDDYIVILVPKHSCDNYKFNNLLCSDHWDMNTNMIFEVIEY